MLKISALGCDDSRAAIRFVADNRNDCKMLCSLFSCYIEGFFGNEILLDDVAAKLPLDVEVTAIYEARSGKFGWTWAHQKTNNNDESKTNKGQ